jgi:spermidine synthase
VEERVALVGPDSHEEQSSTRAARRNLAARLLVGASGIAPRERKGCAAAARAGVARAARLLGVETGARRAPIDAARGGRSVVYGARPVRVRFSLVAALFFVSGATGLLYEVAFSKLLAYVFGATAYAVSAVLAAFMAGLALGAHLGGKHAGRAERPLAAYGALEIVVGVVCAVSPIALEALTGVYVSVARSVPGSLAVLTAARALMTAFVVMVPTMAMGATLPLLSRVVAGGGHGEREAGGHRLAVLYAINTSGGALGALASAYTILPLLGIRGTMRAAALANVAIGLVAVVVGRRLGPEPAAGEPGDGGGVADAGAAEDDLVGPASAAIAAREERMLTVLAFGSGFLVFAVEVVQTHLLALLIGNSAYAFGLMLAVFLVCLAFGAARAPGFAARHGRGALARGLAIAALMIAVTLPFWAELPRLFAFAGRHVHSWAGREVTRAVAAFVILCLPTVWMGTTFPLLLHRVASREDVASRVGRLTVANTVGTIVGSIATGYLVLPGLGSQGTLRAVTIAFAGLALAAGWPAGIAKLEVSRTALTGAAAVGLALLLPKWDLARLTSGANVYFTAGPPPDAIQFVREDVHGGVTTVARRGPLTTMYTNGKFQGDDGPEMAAQRRFAHFPSLFVAKEDRALVIGLGTGTTLGTIASYPWKHIDVAEISPAIVEASRLFFGGPSLGALDDPRVSLHLNDGRNHLLVASEPYDLVTIELTSVWFAGAASLYSHEFYELVRARLSDGGILQQWVQLHHIRPRELGVIVRTLRGVFPHVALFVGGSQGILVAGQKPLVASAARLAALSKRPEIQRTLGPVPLPGLLSELVSSEADIDRLVADAANDGGPILSTDDNLYLEYATPKGNVLEYWSSLSATLAFLERYRTPDPAARHLGP